MNEQLKELAKHAGIIFESSKQNRVHSVSTETLEKFAELIVKECVDICNQAILQNQDTLSKLKTDELAEQMIIHGSIYQAQKLGKGIKEHFGVEE